MLSPDLVSFVKAGLERGLSRGQIEDILVRAGWPADQVRRSLAGFADIESPIPVPRPAVSTRPREAFLYVVMFMLLFVSAFNLGAVLFALVDLALPDSPAGQRRERLDARRAQDLQVISQAIDRYEATHERLPATLDELQRSSDILVAITDPVTLEPYGYETGEGTAYELCADFELATATAERRLRRGRSFSRHEAGRHCFQLRAERRRTRPAIA